MPSPQAPIRPSAGIEEVAVATSNADARRVRLAAAGQSTCELLRSSLAPTASSSTIQKAYSSFDGTARSKRTARPSLGSGTKTRTAQRTSSPWCLDNDGDPFVWTSDWQTISKVYLEKHPTLPPTSKKNKRDEKIDSRAEM